jgi:hypothetical protein
MLKPALSNLSAVAIAIVSACGSFCNTTFVDRSKRVMSCDQESLMKSLKAFLGEN